MNKISKNALVGFLIVFLLMMVILNIVAFLKIKEIKEMIVAVQSDNSLNFSTIIDLCENMQSDMKHIGRIDGKIGNLNETYEDILVEERKIKFPNPEVEADVTGKKSRAEAQFARNKYAEAFLLFEEIAEYYKNDKDFIFMQNYSLFKINPMDSRNYGKIKTIFENLEANGYKRKEISEVLEYIANESM